MRPILRQLAAVHQAQLGWRRWLRGAWWVVLLPVAIACWTASRPGVPIKVVGWAAASFALLFYAGVVDASVNPVPPATTTAKVAASGQVHTANKATSRSPTPTSAPTPEASLAPPVSEMATTAPATTPPTTTVTVAVPPPPVVAAVAPAPVVAAVAPAPPPAPVHTTRPQPVVTHTTTAPAPAVGCTTTSSGKCIQGGQFCPVAKEGQAGYDASGDRYVCTDSDNDGHPHWE